MRSKRPNNSSVRSFERQERIRQLIEADIIGSAADIPADAIPATIPFVRQCRSSIHNQRRPPYFRALDYRCADCDTPAVWTADEQRQWYERSGGSPYSTAVRCQTCRVRRRDGLTRLPRKS